MKALKKWFGKVVRDSMYASEEESQAVIQHTRGMESMFGSATPAVVAFKISNGYVVRTVDTHSDIVGMRQGGFHYCKDHQEIAEHIITVEAKRKLGVRDEEYQQEMFAAEKARAVAMQGSGNFAQVKRATNRI